MPNARTSDLEPALPTSIEGPFVVADPANPVSQIKIDPAQKRIAASADARPTKRMTLGYVRTSGTSLSATIGNGMSCRQVAPGNDGGFHTALFEIPPDFDTSEPMSLYVLIAPAITSAMTGAVTRLDAVAGYTRHAQSAPHSTTTTLDHSVPDAWQANSAQIVLLDNGNGYTFPPSLFEIGDFAGFRIRLARSAAADTFDRDMKLGAGAVLTYTSTEL